MLLLMQAECLRLIFRLTALLNVLPVYCFGLLWVDALHSSRQPAASQAQADSSETKQSTVINEDIFQLS